MLSHCANSKDGVACGERSKIAEESAGCVVARVVSGEFPLGSGISTPTEDAPGCPLRMLHVSSTSPPASTIV